MYDNVFLSSYLQAFQDIAGEHADLIGCGYEPLLSKGLIWVVVRMRVDVYGSPIESQKVLLKTKVKRFSRLTVDREFQLVDPNTNTVYATGLSTWCISSFSTRRLVRPIGIKQPDSFNEDYLYKEELRALPVVSIDHNVASPFTHKVQYTDIDHNHHMNNCKYADMITNLLSLSKKSYSIEINYENEAHLDQILRLYLDDKSKEKEDLISGYNNDNTLMFKAKVIFDKKAD